MKTKTLATINSMNRSRLRAFLLIPFVLACFALSPQAQAACNEGCLLSENTALGEDALSRIDIFTGGWNTAVGFNALFSNASGDRNTATGAFALLNNSSDLGNDNTAIGFNALSGNISGSQNTAVGSGALLSGGSELNTAIGFNALYSNTSLANTAAGAFALYSNTLGFDNTATGGFALESNTTGSFNTATGMFALHANVTGRHNTATGFRALARNLNGDNNIALGFEAGYNLTTGNDNIDIGNRGAVGDTNTIRIGRQGIQTATFIAGISGATVPTGVTVIVDTDGHLGTTTSSARFKEAIKPMDKASEAIHALKPVTFRYKHELDPASIPQFGLVAEEVVKVNPDLVARDEQGKPYTVRYEAVNAMLLNEFLKEHRKVEEHQATIAQLKAADAKQEEKISALTELVKAQAAQIQKVSAQLEVNKTASQIVLNN